MRNEIMKKVEGILNSLLNDFQFFGTAGEPETIRFDPQNCLDELNVPSCSVNLCNSP